MTRKTSQAPGGLSVKRRFSQGGRQSLGTAKRVVKKGSKLAGRAVSEAGGRASAFAAFQEAVARRAARA
jgi:hypothetical protein